MNMSDFLSMGWKITGFGVLSRNCYSCIMQSTFVWISVKNLVSFNFVQQLINWTKINLCLIHIVAHLLSWNLSEMSVRLKWSNQQKRNSKTIFIQVFYNANFVCRKVEVYKYSKFDCIFQKKSVQSTCMSKLINNFQQ